MPSDKELENWFTYHAPNDQQKAAYQRIREAGLHLAKTIAMDSPSGPDQTVAIRKVREAVMAANQAIACAG